MGLLGPLIAPYARDPPPSLTHSLAPRSTEIARRTKRNQSPEPERTQASPAEGVHPFNLLRSTWHLKPSTSQKDMLSRIIQQELHPKVETLQRTKLVAIIPIIRGKSLGPQVFVLSALPGFGQEFIRNEACD